MAIRNQDLSTENGKIVKYHKRHHSQFIHWAKDPAVFLLRFYKKISEIDELRQSVIDNPELVREMVLAKMGER